MGKMEKNEGRREGGKGGDKEREGGKECLMVAKYFVGFKWSMLEMEVSYQVLYNQPPMWGSVVSHDEWNKSQPSKHNPER